MREPEDDAGDNWQPIGEVAQRVVEQLEMPVINASRTLVRYDAMCHAIAEAYSVDEVKDIRDRAAAMAHYHRLAHNTEAERQCTEIRLRAERRWRQLYDAGPKATGTRGQLIGPGTIGPREDRGPSLADHGVSYDEAARGAKLAALSDDEFEDRLRQPGRLTNASVLADDSEPEPEVVPVEDRALWVWGRLCDFERDGLLETDPTELLQTMTEEMLTDVFGLAPRVADWLMKLSSLA